MSGADESLDTRVRPYSCHICHKSYARSDVLFRHCKNHDREAPANSTESAANRVAQSDELDQLPSSTAREKRQEEEEQGQQEQQDINANPNPDTTAHRSSNASGDSPEGLSEWDNIVVSPVLQPSSPEGSNRSAVAVSHSESLAAGLEQHHIDTLDHAMLNSMTAPASHHGGDVMANVNLTFATETMGDTIGNDLSVEPPTAKSPEARPGNASAPARHMSLMAGPLMPAGPDFMDTENSVDHSVNRLGHSFSQEQLALQQSFLPAPDQFNNPQENWWLSFGDSPSSTAPYSSMLMNNEQITQLLNGNGHPFIPPAHGASHSVAVTEPASAPLGKKLSRLHRFWGRRAGEASKPMATFWNDVSTGKGLFGNLDQNPALEAIERVRRHRTLNEETKHRMCAVFQSILDPMNNQHSTAPFDPDTIEIAYEQYWVHHHNVMSLIHAPTFRAEKAPVDLLVVMCTIGMTVMGTPELNHSVDKIYPGILKRVFSSMQNIDMGGLTALTDRLAVMFTALFTLNLGAINSDREGFSKVESVHTGLFAGLVSTAQKDGLFSADKFPASLAALATLPTEEKRWRVWASVESVKRLILGIVQLDCWFAAFFATEPALKAETVCVMPICDRNLFEATTREKWCQVRPEFYQMDYPCVSASYSKTPTIARSFDMMSTLLMVLQLRFAAASAVIERNVQPEGASPPWRLFRDDFRIMGLVVLIVDLSRAANRRDRSFEMNSAVRWHTLCMSLSANIRLLENAAGRSGPEPASLAMAEISKWAATPPARRAALHAAQIFHLLYTRRVCEPVKLQSIIGLFQAALVLGFYICTRPDPTSTEVFDMYDDVDWAALGSFGLSDHPQELSPEILRLPEAQYILQDRTLCLGDYIVTNGPKEARKSWLYFASIMLGMGRWKTRTYSHIMHVMCDSLSDVELPPPHRSDQSA
ncbi:unnamed protein product [Clonostachys rosea]|uniref:C2H2-type domain-containing protein n=1 Tax=Bionectria ochroleuca TaxID=29856 RepID=A0ABY6V1Z7_BIOOC|nr:unnamed protein product [Clonostachys rosea]